MAGADLGTCCRWCQTWPVESNLTEVRGAFKSFLAGNFEILPQPPSEVIPWKKQPALSQKWQCLTIILAQDESINASESKHIQEVPGSRAHPDKSEQAWLISVQSWLVISFQKHAQTVQGLLTHSKFSKWIFDLACWGHRLTRTHLKWAVQFPAATLV